ncbi:MAG TPA: Uma2 family endonuclease [Chloroflexota bacterium]
MPVERKLITADELLRLPDDGTRHELIDGELRTMAPAGGPHGRDANRISLPLNLHIYTHDLGEGFTAETGFLLLRDPDRVRAPDFAFIRAERLPSEGLPPGYVPIAPDLVVEVVSPGDAAGDVREKIQDWLRFGARAVWVVYSGPRLDAYLADGSVLAYGPDDEIDGGQALPGFRMLLRDLLRPAAHSSPP